MNRRDTLYYWYFLIHIPVTAIIDACIVIPKENRHWVQQVALDFHIAMNKDFLLAHPPLWLQVFGWFELLVQMPIFVFVPIALRAGSRKVFVVMTIYGFNAFLTTVVCLTYVLDKGEAHGLTVEETWNLAALYAPYVVIPFFMMIDSGWRLMRMIETENSTTAKAKTKKTKTKGVKTEKTKAKIIKTKEAQPGSIEMEEIETEEEL